MVHDHLKRNVCRGGASSLALIRLALLTTLLVNPVRLAAQPCPCNTDQPFGSCVITDVGNVSPSSYPGTYPGSAFVVEALDPDPLEVTEGAAALLGLPDAAALLEALGLDTPGDFIIAHESGDLPFLLADYAITLGYEPTDTETALDLLAQDLGFTDEFTLLAEIDTLFLPPPDRVFVVDLFGGMTYRYATEFLDIASEDAVEFVSPRASEVTSGVAIVSSQDQLYWAIGDRLVVTEIPTEEDREFRNVLVLSPIFDQLVPLELPIDMGQLADLVLGDEDRAGRLGGLTYHAGRDTLWAVDIVNDIYFEVNLDGSLSLDGVGQPIHFRSPALSERSGKAFGNAITYVADRGEEYFDITVGTIADGRPLHVQRVLAPTSESEDRVFGMDTGIRYPLFPDLVDDDPAGSAFVTGLYYRPDSCGTGQASEYLLVHKLDGDGHTALEISADPPQVGTVADPRAEVQASGGVQLSWRPTGTYDTLTIRRTSITDPSQPVETVATIDGSADPGTILDASLPLPPDGTYEYRFEGTAGGASASPVTTLATVGRGAWVAGAPLVIQGAASDVTPVPYGLARAGSNVLVADINEGIAQTYDVETLLLGAPIEGPFANPGERTTGVTLDTEENRLYWVGQANQENRIQSTAPDGTDARESRPVQYPSSILRNPDLGDVAFDPQGPRFWTVDRRHNLIFAVDREGLVASDMVLDCPIAGDVLVGGIALVSSSESAVVLDLTVADADDAKSISVVRASYPVADPSSPETIHRLAAGTETFSGDVRGTLPATRGGDAVVFVVCGDTRRLEVLTLEPASIGDLPYLRGDSNNDGRTNISDASHILSYLFKGGAPAPCAKAADVDASGEINLSDALVLFNYLFRQGEAPPAPFPGCGFDPSSSPLECETTTCIDE